MRSAPYDLSISAARASAPLRQLLAGEYPSRQPAASPASPAGTAQTVRFLLLSMACRLVGAVVLVVPVPPGIRRGLGIALR